MKDMLNILSNKWHQPIDIIYFINNYCDNCVKAAVTAVTSTLKFQIFPIWLKVKTHKRNYYFLLRIFLYLLVFSLADPIIVSFLPLYKEDQARA